MVSFFQEYTAVQVNRVRSNALKNDGNHQVEKYGGYRDQIDRNKKKAQEYIMVYF